jgi:hypothetical protein
MVEYAVLLGRNASNLVSLTGTNLVTWISGLDWNVVGLAVLALITLRMGVVIFRR